MKEELYYLAKLLRYQKIVEVQFFINFQYTVPILNILLY